MGRLVLVLVLAGGALCSGDWTVTNRLPFDPNLREPEFDRIEADPSLLCTLFDLYRAETGLPYVYLIAANWLEYNPLGKYQTMPKVFRRGDVTITLTGYAVGRGYRGAGTDLHPLEIGNLNGDDVVDFKDFAIAAQYVEAWRHGTAAERVSSGGGQHLHGRTVGICAGGGGVEEADGHAVPGDYRLSGDCARERLPEKKHRAVCRHAMQVVRPAECVRQTPAVSRVRGGRESAAEDET